MNERIRELAKQARAEVRADWDKENKIPYPEAHYVFQRDNDQRFAELIVQECASICEEMSAKCAGLPGDGALAQDCANYIRQDFGVEE
jgi:hypothetical protein